MRPRCQRSVSHRGMLAPSTGPQPSLNTTERPMNELRDAPTCLLRTECIEGSGASALPIAPVDLRAKSNSVDLQGRKRVVATYDSVD